MLAGEIATYSREKRYLRRDGAALWIELTVSLRRDADGAPLHFISVIQDIAGRNFYRPTDAKAAAKYASQFPKLTLVTIDAAFGGWPNATKTHFADGAIFDQIYIPK